MRKRSKQHEHSNGSPSSARRNQLIHRFSKPMGQMQYHCAETGDRGGAIIVNREEALALAEAFAELAKDIEGSEKIARLGNMGEVA